jgi:hypothetical protein
MCLGSQHHVLSVMADVEGDCLLRARWLLHKGLAIRRAREMQISVLRT